MFIIEEKLKELMSSDFENIGEEDLNRLSNLFYYSYFKKYYKYVDGDIKHIKPYYFVSNYLVNELISKFICKYFGDSYIKTEVVREYNTGIFYLVSENFIVEKLKYTTLNDRIFSELNLENFNNNVSFIENVDKLSFNKKDLLKLKKDLKRMIIIDFISNCYDRAFRNFMVGYSKDKIKMMPLYDFEFSFKEGDKGYRNVFSFDFHNFFELQYIRNDYDFQEFLNMAMDLDMKKIIDEFHDEHPIILEEAEIKKYSYIVCNKQKVIKERRLIK